MNNLRTTQTLPRKSVETSWEEVLTETFSRLVVELAENTFARSEKRRDGTRDVANPAYVLEFLSRVIGGSTGQEEGAAKAAGGGGPLPGAAAASSSAGPGNTSKKEDHLPFSKDKDTMKNVLLVKTVRDSVRHDDKDRDNKNPWRRSCVWFVFKSAMQFVAHRVCGLNDGELFYKMLVQSVLSHELYSLVREGNYGADPLAGVGPGIMQEGIRRICNSSLLEAAQKLQRRQVCIMHTCLLWSFSFGGDDRWADKSHSCADSWSTLLRNFFFAVIT